MCSTIKHPRLIEKLLYLDEATVPRFRHTAMVYTMAVIFLPRGIVMATKRNRPDKDGSHRPAFERNKKKIYATQTVCGICGKPVDFSQRYPHPLSACIDHIVPVAKGGHPSDIENMQLAHWTCNRSKADKLFARGGSTHKEEVISNRILPHSKNWEEYRSK